MTECVSGTHITPLYGGKPKSCGVLLPNLECKVSPITESPQTYDKWFSAICMEFIGGKMKDDSMVRGPEIYTRD